MLQMSDISAQNGLHVFFNKIIQNEQRFALLFVAENTHAQMM